MPSTSDINDIAACPLSSTADSPSALPSPSSSLLQSVTLLACSLNAHPYMLAIVLYYCTLQGTVLKNVKCFISCVCFFFLYYFCGKHYKPIKVWYYIANFVSWVVRVTLLDL